MGKMTAVEAERVTELPNGGSQLLYFTSQSLRSDDSQLVYIGTRAGQPSIYECDLGSGKVRQLTDDREGVLKSYVYFDGTPHRGFGKASVSLHAPSGTIYYIHGREIRKLTSDGVSTALSELPRGQMTAFTHVSTDGKRLCVPTTDELALDGDKKLSGQPGYDIDQRVQAEDLSSYLSVIDTESGSEKACEEVPRSWITHVQFAPDNSSLILYNYE